MSGSITDAINPDGIGSDIIRNLRAFANSDNEVIKTNDTLKAIRQIHWKKKQAELAKLQLLE